MPDIAVGTGPGIVAEVRAIMRPVLAEHLSSMSPFATPSSYNSLPSCPRRIVMPMPSSHCRLTTSEAAVLQWRDIEDAEPLSRIYVSKAWSRRFGAVKPTKTDVARRATQRNRVEIGTPMGNRWLLAVQNPAQLAGNADRR